MSRQIYLKARKVGMTAALNETSNNKKEASQMGAEEAAQTPQEGAPGVARRATPSEALSGPENGLSRRPGAGLYLTAEEIRVLRLAIYFLQPLPARMKPLEDKLDRAAERVGEENR